MDKIPTIHKEEYTDNEAACRKACAAIFADMNGWAKHFEITPMRMCLYALALSNYADFLSTGNNAMLARAEEISQELHASMNQWPNVRESLHI